MDKDVYIKNLEDALYNLINFFNDQNSDTHDALADFLDAYPEHRDTMEKARA